MIIHNGHELTPKPISHNITTLQHTALEIDGMNRDVKVTVENMVSIEDYLELFADFLRGIGFRFDGELEIVDPDDDMDDAKYLGKNPYESMEDGKDE